MGNWMTDMKRENRELKKKVKELEKQPKQSTKPQKPITIIKKSKKEKFLRHKLHNALESNRQYEDIINRFSGENENLREGELEAQRAFDDEQTKRKIFKAKAIKIVIMLNRWLGKLDRAAIEEFKDSPDYPVFAKFYDKYIRDKPVEVTIDNSGEVKEV